MKKLFAGLLLISLVLTGCSISNGDKDGNIVSFNGSSWEFVDYNATLKFNNGNYGISAGCNSLGGSFTMDESDFGFGSAISTRMFCSADIQKTETELSKFVSTVTDYKVSGNKLTLIGDEKELTLNKVIAK